MTITGRVFAAALAAAALGVAGVPSARAADGYWSQTSGAVWKNASGLCWRAGYWTPAMATEECDPDLVKKAAPPPPPPPPMRAAPAPKPAAPKAVVLHSTVHFPLGGAKLDNLAMLRLDQDVIDKLGSVGEVAFVVVSGYTDRLGSARFNQRLSEKRGDAVKAYLVSKGMDASKIDVTGYGKSGMGSSQPFPTCHGVKERRALIACLAPNRRVEVEVHGKPK